MRNLLRHLFLPHQSNNQRAKLLHSHIIVLLVLVLLGSSFLLSTAKQYTAGVLGASVDISGQDLLLLTNIDRSHSGLPVLQLNSQLTQAAEAKAQDMFAKQYWAHFSPTGESPWDFIRQAGYSYVYAGENLARGFTSAQDVENAWMNSPEHRANILSPNYQDVGFAIERGPLPGDSDTVLVVEMFGSQTVHQTSTVPPVAIPQVTSTPQASAPAQALVTVTPTPTPSTVVLAAVKTNPLFNSAFITKTISYILLAMFLIIFALDLIVTESRKSVRLAGHSFDHLLFLLSIFAIAVGLGIGVIY